MRVFSITVLMFFFLAARGQEVGLSLSSLKKQFAANVPGTLQKVKEMGFTQVEFSSTYGLSFPEFIKLLAVNNLSVSGFETSLERLEKFPQSAIDEARSYGAKYIVCKYQAEGKIFTRQDADRVAAILNASGKIVSKNGLLLCYQPSGIEFQPEDKGTMFDYFVQKLDIRFVHLQLDVFWVKQAGHDPVALLKKYPTRFIMIDLKDRKKGTPFSLEGTTTDESCVILGKGDAGIAEIVKAAKELGIQQFFIDDPSPKAEQQIPKSLQFLKTVM